MKHGARLKKSRYARIGELLPKVAELERSHKQSPILSFLVTLSDTGWEILSILD